ncbi:hypothetical protein RND71_014053 [Anisodus tanguticus]|uniref:Kinesin motor domain-containing protein n=1 Tax=Anisodus tanguticus TaxID=243964 RepID=A0AAE1VDU7_9SOLA|nr:hypothetical protein RND71_014053 [Anisodus tanguticus]
MVIFLMKKIESYAACMPTLEAATIFAYGKTSSGKTFTMRGITESVVNNIYEHIKFTSSGKTFTMRGITESVVNNIYEHIKFAAVFAQRSELCKSGQEAANFFPKVRAL